NCVICGEGVPIGGKLVYSRMTSESLPDWMGLMAWLACFNDVSLSFAIAWLHGVLRNGGRASALIVTQPCPPSLLQKVFLPC
ncbi:MAG: hypothetical protein AAFO61_14200, partial [Pseudomonadota bacterium]